MRTPLLGCCVTAIALLLSACDRETRSGVGLSGTGPSPYPLITTSIQHISTAQVPPFGTGCSVLPVSTFDVVIVATVPMRVDNVTIAMVNGQNLGGPMVTFPQPALTAQFGTTALLPGVARTFSFTPQFPCAAFLPSHVTANIALLDAAGQPRTVTASGPFP